MQITENLLARHPLPWKAFADRIVDANGVGVTINYCRPEIVDMVNSTAAHAELLEVGRAILREFHDTFDADQDRETWEWSGSGDTPVLLIDRLSDAIRKADGGGA